MVFAATAAVAFLDLHTAVLLVPAVLAIVVLVAATVVASARRGWVVRLGDEGYRVQWVRGVGVAAARWKDVEDAVTTTRAGSPCVVLRLRNGGTTTIPVDVLAGRPRGVRARPAAPPHRRTGPASAVIRCRTGPDSADPVAVACSLCGLVSASVEASPSPVYGARLLSGFGATTPSRVQIPPPPPSSRPPSAGARVHFGAAWPRWSRELHEVCNAHTCTADMVTLGRTDRGDMGSFVVPPDPQTRG